VCVCVNVCVARETLVIISVLTVCVCVLVPLCSPAGNHLPLCLVLIGYGFKNTYLIGTVRSFRFVVKQMGILNILS